MTGLMVIIIVLLIALIVWALGITILYAQLVRMVKRVVAADTDALTSLFSSQAGILQLIRETLDSMEAVQNLTIEYRAKIDMELDKSSENTRFALDTIQQARRIYNTVNNLLDRKEEEPHATDDDNE